MDEPLPDELALRADLAQGAFTSQAGVRWGEPRIDWPHIYLWVQARPTKTGPDRYWIRITCDGYPSRAPGGTFWDVDSNAQLAKVKRPAGTDEVQHVFQTQPSGDPGAAIYAAWDRCGLTLHPEWVTNHGSIAWKSGRTIVDYLDEVHRLLDSEEYTGAVGATG